MLPMRARLASIYAFLMCAGQHKPNSAARMPAGRPGVCMPAHRRDVRSSREWPNRSHTRLPPGRMQATTIVQRKGIGMNRDRLAGNWKRCGGLLREQWGRLSGDQSAVDAGKRDQLAGKVQVRHGVSKDETERQVRDFMYRNRNWDLSRRGTRL